MRFLSLFASIMLHGGLVLLVLLWPTKPVVDFTQAVQISLVEGTMGGELQASPVLGIQGSEEGRKISEVAAPDDGLPMPPAEVSPPADTPPAPEPKEPGEPVDSVKPVEQAAEVTADSVVAPVPPPPAPDAHLISENKAVEVPKPKKESEKKKEPEPKKEPAKKEQPKQAQKKPQPKPKPKPQPKKPTREEAIAAALKEAEQSSSRSGQESPSRDQATVGAVADLRRLRKGTGGGGGGEGSGQGGGGILDAYLGAVVMAVQPHWSTATFSSGLVVVVYIKMDMHGNVLDCSVVESSGNPAFDGSAVNAVRRARILPSPPNPGLQEINIGFNSNLGR